MTLAGTVRAEFVVRATEGYTASLPEFRRAVAPVYSSSSPPSRCRTRSGADRAGAAGDVQRPPQPDHLRAAHRGRPTGVRGRGAPYHWGRGRDRFDREPRVFARLRATLVDLFPVLAPVRFTHAWGGALGVPRDWVASVGLDRATGVAWAGGYVGDGVSTTNLAGRTLRDLVLGRDSQLTRLPWVNHHSPRWEPEPLRWLE
ncbi:MAG: hypothetical protein R2731_19010 [Nocardioides sp.]